MERTQQVGEHGETGPGDAMSTQPGRPAPPRWTAVRVSRPVRDLARSTAFYRDLLGLPHRGGFQDREDYDGAFFGLPGGGELELTAGPAEPRPGSEEDLLVLYLSTPDEVRRVAAGLATTGVPAVPSANPWWDRWGHTVLDPDGYRVVVAARPDVPDADLRVELWTGPRERLRWSFELAEDSPTALDSYLSAGRVLVAVAGSDVVGHLQLVGGATPAQAEITNMAVRGDLQGRGIGARLVRAAVELLAAEGVPELVVATAAADPGNLRFYQRQGFRLRSVQRDAFTPATGYPPGIEIDGVELRDRVWLDRLVAAAATP